MRAKVPSGDAEAAVEEILKVYGSGKKITVLVWKRAESHLPSEIQQALGTATYSNMPQTYIFDKPRSCSSQLNREIRFWKADSIGGVSMYDVFIADTVTYCERN